MSKLAFHFIFNLIISRKRAPPSGLDISAPVAQKVIAPAVGKIIAMNDFVNRKTIFLDHGKGWISLFCHLSDYQVLIGQIVQQSEIIVKIAKVV